MSHTDDDARAGAGPAGGPGLSRRAFVGAMAGAAGLGLAACSSGLKGGSSTSTGTRHAERRCPAQIYLDSIFLEGCTRERAGRGNDDRLDAGRHAASGELRTLPDQPYVSTLFCGETSCDPGTGDT